MERQIILNRLLNKYEVSKHLQEPGISNRRVMLRITGKDLPEYDFENATIRDRYNECARKLEGEGLVALEWVASRPVLSIISLNLNGITESYDAVGRISPHQAVAQACALVEDWLSEVTAQWIHHWGQDFCMQARKKVKLPKFCQADKGQLQDVLCALHTYDSLEGDPITLRAFSLRCFQDSKHFEREVQDTFLSIVQSYSPELQQLVEDNDGIKLSSREMLDCLGIYARAELYELSGPCSIITTSGTLDIRASAPCGIAIPSTLVEAIEGFDLHQVNQVMFIENKTNYEEYLKHMGCDNQLVVYHGGFLSPQKRRMIEKLAEVIPEGVPVFFWADIDLGGFRMFSRLQQLIPTLQPMGMGEAEVVRFASCGLIRSEAYLNKLRQVQTRKEFYLFRPAIEAILHDGVTIEQEIFLTIDSRLWFT